MLSLGEVLAAVLQTPGCPAGMAVVPPALLEEPTHTVMLPAVGEVVELVVLVVLVEVILARMVGLLGTLGLSEMVVVQMEAAGIMVVVAVA